MTIAQTIPTAEPKPITAKECVRVDGPFIFTTILAGWYIALEALADLDQPGDAR